MNNVMILLLSLFAMNQVASQSITIVDCKSQKSINYAHIKNLTTGKSVISNNKGIFKLEMSGNDKIEVSHISYGRKILVSNEIQKTICLDIEPFILEEVTISSEEDKDLIQNILDNTKKKLMLPLKFNAYFKEFVKKDEKYTHFSDADITYFVKHKKNELAITGSISQSRASKSIKSDDNDKLDLDFISPVGYKKLINYFDPSNLGRFFSKINHYDFSVSKNTGNWVIEIKPIDEGLFEGTILIDKSDTTISAISFHIPKECIKYTKETNAIVAKVKLLENKAFIQYTKHSNGKIYPTYIRMEYDISIKNQKDIDQTSSFITDIGIYNIPENQSEIPRKQLYKKKSVFKRGTDFKTEFWKDKSLIHLTDIEKSIINDLLN